MESSKVVIVDISSFSHSAWHAYPQSLGSDGLCYRVIHGVMSKLHKMERDVSWDYAIGVLDNDEGSLYRKSIYPEYKAHRDEKDADFVRQLALLPTALGAMGLRTLQQSGVEADDLIGSLSYKHAKRGDQALVVSADKDLAQLVNEKVSLLRPLRGVAAGEASFEYLDLMGIKERYGVEASQIADWLALIGDTSDNIPGVHKVGPKVAARWLNEYGDLETILTIKAQIKGTTGENLRAAAEFLPKIKKLTTILRDIDVPFIEEIPLSNDEMKKTQMRERMGLPKWMGQWIDLQK